MSTTTTSHEASLQFGVRPNTYGWFEVVYPAGYPQAGLIRSTHPTPESAQQAAEEATVDAGWQAAEYALRIRGRDERAALRAQWSQ